MLTYWVDMPPVLLLLMLLSRATGTSGQEQHQQHQHLDSRSYRVDSSFQHANNPLVDNGYPDGDGVRRFECPAGFFRLRRSCYYLSGGMAPWRAAHFQCTARNATLAVLNHHGKDKLLRKYLMGDQFRKLERWIGGIYNWRQMEWEWGVSGDKVLYQNFGIVDDIKSKNYTMHCLVLDSKQHYKWNARSCIEEKYFICEVPAGRIQRNRRRKNVLNPLAPQNQRLRPANRDKLKRRRKNNLKSMKKNNWLQLEDNQIWVHGIKPGSRPPKGTRRTRPDANRTKGPRHSRKQGLRVESRITQATPAPGTYGAFGLDGGRILTDEHLQNLGETNELAYSDIFRSGADFAHEEILLKL